MHSRLAILDAISQRLSPSSAAVRCERSSVRPAGFTLVELVLVMGLLALLMAVAAPDLRGWSRNGKLRDATDQMMASIRYARGQAIHDAVTYRLSVDPTGTLVQVQRQEGGLFVAIDDTYAGPIIMPDGFVVEIDRLDGGLSAVVDFFPDGRTTPARIVLTAPWGRQVVMAAPTAAQPFELVASAGGMP